MFYWTKKHETVPDNPAISIYVNETEKGITFKIKTGHYLEVLTPETMKLLWSTKSKIIKDENGESAPHVETAEVILLHCNMVNNRYQQDSTVLHTSVPNKSFGELLDISPWKFHTLKSY